MTGLPTIIPQSEAGRIRKLKAKRVTDTAIAGIYGVAPSTIYCFRKRHGIPINYKTDESARKRKRDQWNGLRFGYLSHVLEMIPHAKREELLAVCAQKGYTVAEAIAEALERD